MGFTNSFSFRSGLLAASFLTAAVTAASAQTTPASAPEQTPSASPDKLDDIVVTARKREESLQKVPLTITAFSSKSIEESGLRNVYDVARSTPGLYYGTTGGRGGGNKLQIRNFSTGTSGGSKASVFIDGVYSAGDYSSLALANLDRVEVLKGPQSAYFGRSTFVGAVNYVTKDPGNVFTGKLDLTAATLGEYDENGYITTPIVADKLSNTITGRFYSFRGSDKWKNAEGYHFGNERTISVTDKLVFHPSSDVKISWYGSYLHDRDHLASVIYSPLSNRNSVIARPDGTFGYYYSGAVGLDYNSQNYLTRVAGAINDPGILRNQYRSTLSLEANVLGQHLTGFASYGDEKLRNNYDAYFLGAGSVTIPNAYRVPTTYSYNQSNYLVNTRTKDKQAELRLTSPSDWRLRYLIGYNYTKLYGSTIYGYDPTTATGAPLLAAPSTIVSNNSWIGGNPAEDNSVFGALYFDLTSKITLTGEVRHQWEHITSVNYLTNAHYSAHFQATLPRINLQYKANDHLQFYAVYSIGNNPGGFNTSTPIAFLPAGVQQAYGEERLYNYEGGMKSTWLDGKLLVNLAVFHMDWKHQQVLQSYVTNYPNPGGVAALTTASARSYVTGFESEVQAILAPGLDVRATASYGKAKYKNYCSSNYFALTGVATGLACRSVNGYQQEGTPAFQMSFEANYSHPINDRWNGFIRADYEYQSKIYLEEWDASWTNPANVVNARIGVESNHLTAELFVRNLLDDDHSVRGTRATYAPVGGPYPAVVTPYGTVAAGAAGYQDVAGSPRKPRQIGVRLGYKF